MDSITNNSQIEELKDKKIVLQVFKSIGKFGTKGLKYLVSTFVLFSMINFLSFVYAVFNISSKDTSFLIISIFLIYFIGVVFTTTSIYLTYRYLKTEGLFLIYKHSSIFFEKVCNTIIDKISSSNIKISNLTKENFNTIINTTYIAYSLIDKKTPKYIQQGLIFILNKIPFLSIILDLKDVINLNNQSKTSKSLYQQINSYAIQSIFGVNSMRWLYWLIPLNIGLQILIIYLLSK